MSVKVKMQPTSTIKAQLGINPNGVVQKYFVKKCADHMDKYVPFRTGQLAKYKIQGNLIIYDQPYAHYMYEGKVMGPNIPIKNKDGLITGWCSPKGKAKRYTGKDIVYNKSGHQFAGPYWDERMWSAEKDDIIKEVQELINSGGY